MSRIGYVFCLVMFAVCAFAKETEDKLWSKAVNGVRAKITMRERTVLNGTRIVAVYLNLQNVADFINPLKISWKHSGLSLKVTDEDGNEFPKVGDMAYSGSVASDFDLVILPFDSTLFLMFPKMALVFQKTKRQYLIWGVITVGLSIKLMGKSIS